MAVNNGGNSAVAAAAAQKPELATLITRYFRHIPAEDLPTQVSDVFAIITAHQRLAMQRPQNTPKIRVFNPQTADDEWSSAATVVNIVNDDMPYLVDSVISALTAAGVVVFRVLHPILDVRRDHDGNMIEVLGAASKGSGSGGFRGRDVFRESWVHLLVDRITDAERAENFELEVTNVLAQVRDVVEDTDEMSNTVKELAATLRRNPPQLPAQEIIEAADLLDWLADGHLTFLGYQQFETSSGSLGEGQETTVVADTATNAGTATGAADPRLRPIQSSGIGLFRDNVDAEGFTAKIVTKPETAKRLLVLTRASASTNLAKNMQPFYVAVREFDHDGEVIGEHRFIGLLTPGRSTPRLMPPRCCGERLMRCCWPWVLRLIPTPASAPLTSSPPTRGQSCSGPRRRRSSTWCAGCSRSPAGGRCVCSCNLICTAVSSRCSCSCLAIATPPRAGWP